MIRIYCDREECESSLAYTFISDLIDFQYEEVKLPEGWFEVGQEIYCDKHEKRERTGYYIVDKEVS